MNGTIVPVTVKGAYLTDSASGPTPLIILADETGRMMPIYVGLSEAVSINAALNHKLSPRPMTHDLFISLIEKLELRIDEILIDELIDGIYYARLIISKNGSKLEIDARPSDCIALALRAGATVNIQESVLNDAVISKEELQGLLNLDNYL